MYRDHTKVVKIGDRVIGGGNPILIQSMTNTRTEDVEATVSQIRRLTAAGRADNTDKLIFMNIHIHAVEGHHLTVAAVKLLDDVVDMYLYC